MAKKPSTRSKAPAQAALNPIAAAVKRAHDAILPILIGADRAASEAKSAGESRSKQIVAAVSDLSASIADPVAYGNACAGLFGNGKRGKENAPGDLAAELKTAGATSLQVKTLLSWTRTLAADFRKPHVAKAATESGLRAGYEAAKYGPEGKKAAPATAEAPAITGPEWIAAEVKEGRVAALMGMIESACVACAKTIEAARIHEARIALAAK